MTKFYSDMTVEEAISCFPIGSTEVEVLDDSEDFIGFFDNRGVICGSAAE
ncbi:hypothetical protein RCO48_35470 [Peribacillus frigoritolerans]|nr:hypothetical protein [Peribacillus frigoritolerans]